MFALSYITTNDEIALKTNFKSDKEVYNFIKVNKGITPIKLLVWSEDSQCYKLLEQYYK